MEQDHIEQLLADLSLVEQAGLLAGADFWTTVPIPRAAIPAVKLTDGPNGARGGSFQDGPRTACFPAGIALAATWNPDLIEETGRALADEALLKGARVLLAPTVNLHRTVLNGRNFECFSEDPWLTAEIALAVIRGVQSRGVAATIKHFVGNESEFQRMTISSDIDERALRELYLLPFERAVKEAGVMAVMAAYNRLDGIFAVDHERLIQRVLRDEWGFDGLVMSDWGAVHSTVDSVRAGCDLEMPGPAVYRGAHLVQAVSDGRLPAQAVRDCARRVLQLIDRVDGLRAPSIEPERALDLPEHRALIRRLGAESAVLLKNDTDLLPLAPARGQTLALIGVPATEAQIMGGGSATVNAHYHVSPLDALQARLPGVSLKTAPGADIHRWVPLLPTPMAIEFFNRPDLSGPVVARQMAATSEQLWIDRLDPAVDRARFSARARLQVMAAQSGVYQFSLISAGLSRAFVNGDLVVDAWTDWRRGGPYFGWGCDEVVASRVLDAGQPCDIVVEFSSATPQPLSIHALRLGCHRLRGDIDIADAVAAARDADAAIVFAGLNAEWDCENLDRADIALPHRQDELIARVAAVNPRTVVVLQTGAPVALPWLAAVPAVLQAWYPGQECGNAIADVLLGAAEPGGRLPQTWPRQLADSPAQGDPAQYPGVDGHVRYREGVFIGYRHYQAHGIEPMFPFGHGLSYTRFECGVPRVDRASFAPGDTVQVEVEVRNIGARAGQAVVQLYVGDEAAGVSRPPRELKAFAKLSLDPGAAASARFTLDMRALAYFDADRNAWVAEAGRFGLYVGLSSSSLALPTALDLTADWVEPVGSPGG